MTIKKDLGALPKVKPTNTSEAPVIGRQTKRPEIVGTLESWVEGIGHEAREKAYPERTWRASMSALRCNRQLQYAMQGLEESNPFTLADHWRTSLGKILGEQILPHIAGAFARVHDDWFVSAEVPTDLYPSLGINGSSFVELLFRSKTTQEPKLVVEIKSINGMGFKEVAMGWSTKPRAPRTGHMIQTCVEAAAYNVPAVLVYLATELIGTDVARKAGLEEWQRFCAIWEWTADEALAIAGLEKERVCNIERLLERDVFTNVIRFIVDPRLAPPGAVITDPDKGMWMVRGDQGEVVDTGSCWLCGYCPHKARCKADGP